MINVNIRTKQILLIIVLVQVALFGIIELGNVSFVVVFLREIVASISLTIVPGFLIVRILRLNNLTKIELLLLSVGLSLSVLMCAGAALNYLLTILSLANPLSTINLTSTISGIVFLLVLLCYLRDKDTVFSFVLTKDILSPNVLFLLSLPVLSIIGVCFVNYYDSNIILLFLLLLISIVPLFVAFNKIDKRFFPFAIWMIGLALLFHYSLIGNNISGYDINTEYYYAHLVTSTSFWDFSIAGKINGMLSIVILPPVYSEIGNLSLTWVFKIIYPLLFSLVPLGLYQVFQRQIGSNKNTFYSCFFFMAFYVFFTELLSLARQEIAELFLVLLLMIMLGTKKNTRLGFILSTIFGFSLAVSHYGVGYLLMIFLIGGLIIWLITYRRSAKLERLSLFSPWFVLPYVGFTLAYYAAVTKGFIFNMAVSLFSHNVGGLLRDLYHLNLSGIFIATGSNTAIDFMTKYYSQLYSVFRILTYISDFFIVVGLVAVLIRRHRTEFEILALFSFATLILGLVPSLSSENALGFTRVYQIALICLAPFCILGYEKLASLISKIKTFRGFRQLNNTKLLALFLTIFLLFNSSFIFEVANDYSTSISLNQYRVYHSQGLDNILTRVAFYNAYIPDKDVESAEWLSTYLSNLTNGNPKVYADLISRYGVLTSYGNLTTLNTHELSEDSTFNTVGNNSIIYLRTFNHVDGILIGPLGNNWWNISEISSLLDSSIVIYYNNYSVIYRTESVS